MYFLFVSVISSTECYGFNHLRFNHGSNFNSLEKKKENLFVFVSFDDAVCCLLVAKTYNNYQNQKVNILIA